MKTITDFTNQIIAAIREAQQEKLYYKTLHAVTTPVEKNNQFLFFIKPEITINNPAIRLHDIIHFMLQQIEKYKFVIERINVLSGRYMKDYNIIAQHYGVINQISRNAKESISDSAKKRFYEIYEKPFDEAPLWGSLEFIDKYPCFNALSLDYLWQNSPTEKLAGGTYSQQLRLDADTVFLVNGFHPRQLEHFTKPGHSIVTFTLSGDMDWQTARRAFIGATSPQNAQTGSLRNLLLHQKEKFGIPVISASKNGAHLSAGPLEALVELLRYNSDFSKDENTVSIHDFSFGKLLLQHFSEKQIKYILSNPNIQYQNQTISVFDLTEEKNSEQALELLKQTIK